MSAAATGESRELPLAPILLAAGLVTALLGLPSLVYPFGFDQSNQAFIASEVLNGSVLYRDIACLKPPFTILFHSGALALFGHSMSAIRIADLLWTIGTAVVIALLVHRSLEKKRAALPILAAAFYAHLYYSFNYWHTAQTDGWMNLPIALAMLLIVEAWRRRPGPLASFGLWSGVGALLGTALLFKYTALGLLLIFALAALASPERPRWRALNGAGIAFGVIAVILLLLCVSAIWGALDAYLGEHVNTVRGYAASSGHEIPTDSMPRWTGLLFRFVYLDKAITHLRSSPPTFLLGVLGCGFAIHRILRSNTESSQRRQLLLLLGWVAGAWASTAVQGRFFTYHYLPLLAPWSIAGALFVAWVVSGVRPRLATSRSRLAASALAVLALLWALASPHHFTLLPHHVQADMLRFVLSPDHQIEDLWRGEYFHSHSPVFSVRQALDASEQVLEKTTPQQSLFVWGNNNAVYFLTRRPRVTSIMSSLEALSVSPSGEPRLSDLMADFRSSPPSMVLVQHGDVEPHMLGRERDSYQLLSDADPVRAFLSRHYEFLGHQSGFDLLRLRDAGGAGVLVTR